MPETSKPQVLAQPQDGSLPPSNSADWFKKVREMRLDPTLSLARDLVIAPVLAAEWSIESKEDAPEGAVEYIQEQLMNLRHNLLSHTFNGWMDFGWQPFEKVLEIVDGQVVIKKLKPLLQDFTTIDVDKHGAITGCTNTIDSDDLPLTIDQVLVTYTNVEGTNWYGRAWMRAAEQPYDEWLETNDAARKYQNRVSGSHWVLHYPLGQTDYNGTMTDNAVIANDILAKLGSNSKVAFPIEVDEAMAQLNDGQGGTTWKLELISDNGAGADSFETAFRYKDALKVRALRLPERTVLQGEFGTKAEAETHTDIAITNMEQRHWEACEQYNWHLVNHLLRLQYGPQAEGSVFIVPAPIADSSRALLKEIYLAILTDPAGFVAEFTALDIQAIKEKLGIPINADDETDEDFKPSVVDESTDD